MGFSQHNPPTSHYDDDDDAKLQATLQKLAMQSRGPPSEHATNAAIREYEASKHLAIRGLLRKLCPHPSWYAKRVLDHKRRQAMGPHFRKNTAIKYDDYGRPEYRVNRKGDWIKIPTAAELREKHREELKRKIHPSWEAKIKLRQKKKEMKRAGKR
jgi:hypothetical protein